MPTIALQQVTNAFARGNARKTLEKPVRLKYIQKYLELDVHQALESACTDGTVFIWGAKLERVHQFVKMQPNRCLVLFRQGGLVYKTGVMTDWIVSRPLGEYLWGVDADEETWGLVYFLTNVKDLSIPVAEINRIIGRVEEDHWQGLTAVSSAAVNQVIKFVKSELAKHANTGP